MKKKSSHPDWVLAQRKPKTEIRLINGNYYLYEVTSKWNPEKKRSQKITGKLLGKITKDGFVESDKYKLRCMSQRSLKNPPVNKEYGASHFIVEHNGDIIELLKKHFEEHWQDIVALAIIRLIYKSPIKNIGFHFETSYLSEVYKDMTLGEKRVRALYRKFGTMRGQTVDYMRNFITKDDHILIDATNIISYSERIEISRLGYNSKMEHEPQINLMLMYSTCKQIPVYYRVIPGNIREVKAFKLSLDECGAENVTIIADKGFYSQDNIDTLEAFNARYIIPLRRSSKMIDYSLISKENLKDFFIYQNSPIWYTHYAKDQHRIHLFYDPELAYKEEKDYLLRIITHPETHTKEGFFERRQRFGCIALYTNKTEKEPKTIYEEYKIRNHIETMIDAMKNTLLADVSYMQNEEAFNGWMLINFIALQFYYRICFLLKEHDLISKISPEDLLKYLSEIRKTKINDQWITAEIHGRTQKLIKQLNLPIT